MAKDITTDLILSLGKQLNAEFGYTVFVDPQEQGVKPPCFFVEMVSTTNHRYLMGRVQYTTTVRIKYLPQKEEYAFREYYPLVDRLRQTAEFVTISTGEILKGVGINTDHTKKSMVCMVTYNFVVQEQYDNIKMETMEAKNGTKG